MDKILRFPEGTEGGQGGAPTPTPPPVEESQQPAIPKTKEDWDKLSQEDPKRWISLTQTRMDQTIRQSREAQEKLKQEQDRIRNLEAELETFKRGQPPELPAPTGDATKPFSRDNLPKTDDQWETLWIENPNLAADLRHHKNELDKQYRTVQEKQQQEFINARKESAKQLWDRHPDMYVLERDETGNVKKDEHGKPVLRIDPNTGGPMLDLESEKGKLWVQVYNEDPHGYDGAKYGPRLAMTEMERRLRERGEQQLNAGGTGGEPTAGQGQAAAGDQRGVLPSGVTPPTTPKVSFTSEEEKAHATRAVERGVYKDLGQYCQLRDGKQVGVVEENRFPKFN